MKKYLFFIVFSSIIVLTANAQNTTYHNTEEVRVEYPKYSKFRVWKNYHKKCHKLLLRKKANKNCRLLTHY